VALLGQAENALFEDEFGVAGTHVGWLLTIFASYRGVGGGDVGLNPGVVGAEVRRRVPSGWK
jgi:hypothetical protein